MLRLDWRFVVHASLLLAAGVASIAAISWWQFEQRTARLASPHAITPIVAPNDDFADIVAVVVEHAGSMGPVPPAALDPGVVVVVGIWVS